MPNHFSAYPNPFIDTLSFEVEVDNNISTIVKIVNPDGKIVKLLSWNIKQGINKTSLHDLQQLGGSRCRGEVGGIELDPQSAADDRLAGFDCVPRR